MRRSVPLLRGAKGFGWYNKYRSNPEEFAKFTSPTPFDWEANNVTRPRAYFNIKSGGENWGNLEFELANDVLPKTVENFTRLVTGTNAKGLTYKSTKLHQIRKGHVIMGGDVVTNDGTGSHSAFEERFFADENFIVPHSARGLLSMVSVGVNTNGSQFYISLSPTHYLNGRSVVFGRLVKGEEVLQRIEKVFTAGGAPATEITIADCGVIGV